MAEPISMLTWMLISAALGAGGAGAQAKASSDINNTTSKLTTDIASQEEQRQERFRKLAQSLSTESISQVNKTKIDSDVAREQIKLADVTPSENDIVLQAANLGSSPTVVKDIADGGEAAAPSSPFGIELARLAARGDASVAEQVKNQAALEAFGNVFDGRKNEINRNSTDIGQIINLANASRGVEGIELNSVPARAKTKGDLFNNIGMGLQLASMATGVYGGLLGGSGGMSPSAPSGTGGGGGASITPKIS